MLIQAPAGKTLDRQDSQAVAGELRTRLAALPEVASVGSLVRSDDGRSALLPVVLDVDGATGTAAEDLANERIDEVLGATASVAKAHPELTGRQVGDASLDKAINESSARTSSGPRR